MVPQPMDTSRLERETPTMSTWCSNQLSYASVDTQVTIGFVKLQMSKAESDSPKVLARKDKQEN
jgi:hypothetical protein